MKKLLVIGCSFSAGSYETLNNELPELPIKDHRGWWAFVKQFKEYETDVYAISSGGMSIAAYYVRENLIDISKYDCVVIQHTTYPRFQVVEDDHISHIKSYLLNQKRIIGSKFGSATLYHISARTKTVFTTNDLYPEDKVNKCQKVLNRHNINIALSPTIKYINDIGRYYIYDMCRRNNIPVYTWAMFDTYDDFGLGTITLPVVNIYDKLGDLGLLSITNPNYKKLVDHKQSTLHQSLDGNRYLGDQINKALTEIGF